MKLTREQAIAEHRKMWRWIAEETEKRNELVFKREYTNKYFPAEEILNDCFCCEYNRQTIENLGGDLKDLGCQYCPIDWGSKCKEIMCCDKGSEEDERGLFALWTNIYLSAEYKLSAEYARKIAELPEKEDVKQ